MKYRKIIKRINGASVEGFEPVKSSLVTKIFIGIGLLVGLFVIIQASIIYGVDKERQNNTCMSPTQMRNYENTLKIAQTICVDIQKQQMDEIRVGYSGTLDAAKSELERWKGLYLLKVSEIASITNDTATGTEIINN